MKNLWCYFKAATMFWVGGYSLYLAWLTEASTITIFFLAVMMLTFALGVDLLISGILLQIENNRKGY